MITSVGRMARPNVLLITLDQFRADALSCAGHPVVKTPNLDALAAAGVRFANHFSQAAPCSPGRAALYTGTYMSTNRVVANGTPLDARFDNVAHAARRAGYEPTLFGYTDQTVDPRDVTNENDPRLLTYEGVLPGFTHALSTAGDVNPWMQYLQGLGVEVTSLVDALRSEPSRPESQSITAFLTDSLLSWIDDQDGPWFAHASYLRPHPPYRAAGRFASMYDPALVPPPLPVPDNVPGLHRALMSAKELAVPDDPAALARIAAQYFGMVSEVDDNLGRVWAALKKSGQWENTIVIVTADHAEQLGDQGLLNKAGFFDSSYHIIGIVRDPHRPGAHGRVVQDITENVDVFPTLCELMGVRIPVQCDGYPLVPFLDGDQPPAWRDAAYYEWDWRSDLLIQATDATNGDAPDRSDPLGWPWNRKAETQHLTVRRSATRAYVHFANATSACFDLTDPTWNARITDPAVICAEAEAMLTWKVRTTDRTLTGLLVDDPYWFGRTADYPVLPTKVRGASGPEV